MLELDKVFVVFRLMRMRVVPCEYSQNEVEELIETFGFERSFMG